MHLERIVSALRKENDSDITSFIRVFSIMAGTFY